MTAGDTTKKNKRRGLKVVALTAVLMLFGGIAFAYWTAGGAGTGSASTGTTVPVVVKQTSSIAGLAPGAPAKTLSGNFDNSNAGSVFVTSVTVSIASVTKASGAASGTCDATDYTLSNTTMAVGADIPAGNAQGAWTGATIAFNNKATSQDQCKGATVNLAYTAS